MSYLILYGEEYEEIKKILSELKEETGARVALIVEKNGQPIAFSGEMDGVDTTSLGSLVAGNVAATEGLARLLGEQGFALMFNEGQNENLHINLIERKFILAVLFDKRTSLGLVRLRAKNASVKLEKVFTKLEAKMEKEHRKMGEKESPFEDISEDDIEKLFK